MWWLLGGRCHLCGDEGLDDVVSGWQQLAVAVGGVGALVQHQAAGGHCQKYRQKSVEILISPLIVHVQPPFPAWLCSPSLET